MYALVERLGGCAERIRQAQRFARQQVAVAQNTADSSEPGGLHLLALSCEGFSPEFRREPVRSRVRVPLEPASNYRHSDDFHVVLVCSRHLLNGFFRALAKLGIRFGAATGQPRREAGGEGLHDRFIFLAGCPSKLRVDPSSLGAGKYSTHPQAWCVDVGRPVANRTERQPQM